jgi:hypothetical protein
MSVNSHELNLVNTASLFGGRIGGEAPLVKKYIQSPRSFAGFCCAK